MPKPHARIEQIEQNHAVFHKFVENARSQIIARWSNGVLFFVPFVVPFVEGVYEKNSNFTTQKDEYHMTNS